ncbi:MAG TPA: response regulator transcription factor [Anaerolineaceae bacterium]|nr:response regulator transcription factor [Anaerolineaceae bacterium]
MSVTILLADDHPVMRQGLHLLLDAEPDFTIIGETGDGREVMALVERLHPDVLVLDLVMPGLGGLDVARQVHQQAPATKVVILSMYASVAYVVEALAAGASAYIPKKSTAEELVYAIREVVAGRQYLSSALSNEAGDIEQLIKDHRSQTGDTLDIYETLTRREREVLNLVGEGYTSAEIADLLVISPRTVDMHRRNMVQKLGLSGQASLVRYAVKHGLLPDQE